MDGEVPSKDEIPTVFHLLQRVLASEIDGRTVFLGKLGPYDPSPVIELLANDLRAETVGCCL
jgi:hypothetical protein